MAEELCAYPGCGKPEQDLAHHYLPWMQHEFVRPAAPEGEPLGNCTWLGHSWSHLRDDYCVDWKPEAAAPDPKPEEFDDRQN